MKRPLLVLIFLFSSLLVACDRDDRTGGKQEQQAGKMASLQDKFTKPIVKIPAASSNEYLLFGIKDCHVYQTSQTGNAMGEWTLLFKPAPYLLPKTCVRERLEMDGGYLHIEIGTQAIGAGGCCTTYAAYRTRDGVTWEIRPATSIKTWQPLDAGDDNPANRRSGQSNKLTAEQVARFAEQFADRLKRRQPLASLMRSKIDFVFHADNRCEGNTDGVVRQLTASQVDATFTIELIHDGDAWGCDKKAPSTGQMKFSLREHLSSWNRIEAVLESSVPNSFLVQGRGESDYLVVHLENNDEAVTVSKLEYRSEDPG